jgi:hypothetical protein
MPIFSANKTFLLLMIAVTYLEGCGSKTRHKPETQPYNSPFSLDWDDKIESYPLDDEGCQSTLENSSTIDGTRLFSWELDGLREVDASLKTSTINQNPLKANFIGSTHIDSSFLRTCDSGLAPPPSCLSTNGSHLGWKLVNQGQPLRICQTAPTHKRRSAEQLALAAISAIESAGSKLQAFLPGQKKLPPVTVLVAPKFESRWNSHGTAPQHTVYQHFMTDNLSYFSRSESTPPYIAILPRKKTTGSQVDRSVHLWESKFIVTHEYAHHLEDTLGISRFNEPRSSLRISTSEAFADLVAYATLGGSSNLSAIPCIGRDRAPDSAQFYTGIEKILTNQIFKRAIDPSISTQADDPAKNVGETIACQGVSPHSVHGVGAILAHLALELASYTPSFDADLTGSLLRISTSWLQGVDAKIGAGKALSEASISASDPAMMRSDLTSIADALETAVVDEFKRREQSPTDSVRQLLKQKIRFRLEPLVTP